MAKDYGISTEDLKAMYPGFQIRCEKCDSVWVMIESDYGYSELSGSWGGVHLVCTNCDAKVTIWGDE